MIKLLTIVGARPQFVKAAALSRAILKSGVFEEVIVHTGQHFSDNMSSIFFDELGIPAPKINLDVHSKTHGAMTGIMLEGIERVIMDEKPDVVLVYGDTNSTLAGALAAVKLHVPIAHVEAGLRSFNRRMPEEINRVVCDHVSQFLFCPTSESVKNLKNEGIANNVFHVGDVMYDATLYAKELASQRSDILRRLSLKAGTYYLSTIHRAESTDEPALLEEMFRFIEAEADGKPVVFPVHPRTRHVLAQHGIPTGGITLIDPVGYIDMNALIAGAAAVYTDSGGLQKEAYFHGVPCVTLRSETEWVETIECGWNRLWRTPEYKQPRRPIAEYGKGNAAEAVLAELEESLSAR